MSDVVELYSDGESKDNDDVVVSDEVVELLPLNKYRKSALIVNVSGGTLRVTTDGSDPSSNHGKPIRPGASLGLSSPNCPSEPIKGIRQDAEDVVVNASEVS